MTTTNTNANPAGRTRARRWAPLVATIVIAVAGAAAVAPLAVQAMSGGPGMMTGGHGSHFMGRMLERMLDKVGASDAQRTQIRQIAQLAEADMKAQMEAGRALRDQGAALMGAPTLDAVAAEALRQQMLARHDLLSRRMLQAMLDIGNVLTPEQRAKLAEQMGQPRGTMMQHRMGPQGDHRS